MVRDYDIDIGVTRDYGTRKRILELLASSEQGLSWKDLKNELKVSDPVLAKHLKRLIEKGLITEKIDEKDRRVKIYRINDKGLRLLRKDILTIYFFVLIYERFAHSVLPLMRDYKDKDEIKEREKKAIIDDFGLFIRDLILEGLAGDYETFSALLKALKLFKKYVGYEFKNKEYIERKFTVIKLIYEYEYDLKKLLKETFDKIYDLIKYMLLFERGTRTWDIINDRIIIKKGRFSLTSGFIKALEDVSLLLREVVKEVKAKLRGWV